jgi:hypothetical protein
VLFLGEFEDVFQINVKDTGSCLTIFDMLSFSVIHWTFLLSTVLFSGITNGQSKPETLSFKNNDRIVVLTKEDNHFLSDSSGQKYAFNKKILIESSSSLNDIKTLHPSIERVQLIAQLNHTNIFWISPVPSQFFDVYSTLSNSKGVDSIEPDLAPVRKLTTTKMSTSNHDSLIDLAYAPSCDKPVNPVRVAIIDDGFDFSHPELKDVTVLLEYDPDEQKVVASPKKNIDYHGTLVAGVIAAKHDNIGVDGYAPSSDIIAIRQVSTWSSSLVLAFHVAKLMKADIVNCSWIIPFLSDITSMVIDDLASAPNNPIIVVSAGNNSVLACEGNRLAESDSVVVVGAKNTNGSIAVFSNYGECVDVYAPFGVQSTAVNGYAQFGGTSSSAAIVTGILASKKACGITLPLQELLRNKKHTKISQ